METAGNSQNVEIMFQEILGKLQTIEDRLCELEYPQESMIKESFIAEVNRAKKEIEDGNYRECGTAKEFIELLKK